MSDGPELTWEQVAAWRARRHGLHERVPAGAMIDVAARLCGVHAQVMSSAELTLWARVDELPRLAVADALWKERSLVKTWAMRGTLHLLPVRDLGLWLGGLGAIDRERRKPGWYRGFGVSEQELEELLHAIGQALDGEPLSREELASEVGRITGSREQAERVRGSWGPFLKPAAFQGELCFAPGESTRVKFTKPSSWVGKVELVPETDAMREIARRYLAVHGPATREDFARWWSTTPAKGLKALRLLAEDAVLASVEGAPYWMLAADAGDAAAARPFDDVRLLPAFDQYVVAATRHAARLMPGDFTKLVYRPQGWLSPVVVAGGRMLGVWRHERRGSKLSVAVEPFTGKLPRAVRAGVEAEAERLASFLGAHLTLDL